MAQSQAATAHTVQMTLLTRPHSPMVGGYGGGFPGGGPVGAFAQQYQQNMMSMQAQQFNPYTAQMMAGMSGFGGFNQGMMPSPTMMTQPGMGIFRSFPGGPTPTVPPVPLLPLIRTPLTPTLPSPQFHTPFEYAQAMGVQRGQQFIGAGLAAPGLMARGAVDVGAGYLGAGAGAMMGARFGGARGAMIGGTLGLFSGIFGAEQAGLGAAAQHILDDVNPFRQTAIRAQQMRASSQNFVVGGSELDVTGRGLSNRGAAHLGRALEDTGWGSRFRRETGAQFSVQDLTQITNLAGQNGLLDMAQNSEGIRTRVTDIAKALSSFMQLANEPSITEAMRSLSQMRNMGLSLAETTQFIQDARMYARQAGTTVRGVIEQGGLQGAMVFQQQGLTAGLGLQVGAGAYGAARQAVASGTFTEAQLASLGGVSGIAQRQMESSAAFLKQPVLAASMAGLNAAGSFSLQGGNVGALARGRLNVGDMATMGANNLMSAVAQQGVGALGMFQMQQSELQDQLGRALGPQGIQMMQMHQILNTQKTLGVEGPGGFFMAARGMGMDDDAARQMTQQAANPEYFRNMQLQLEVQRRDLRSVERRREEREATTWSEARGLNELGAGLTSALRDGVEGFSTGISDWWESGSLSELGLRTRRRGRRTMAQSPDEINLVNRFSSESREAFRSGVYEDARDDVGSQRLSIAERRNLLYARNKAMSAPLVMASFASAFVPDDAAREEIRARETSDRKVARALSAGLAEQEGAFGKMSQALGSDEAAGRVRARYQQMLANAAKNRGRGNLFGDYETGMTDDFRQDILNQAMVAEGFEASLLDLDTVDTSGLAGARELAGYDGARAFRSSGVGEDSEFRQDQKTLEKILEDTTKDAFGSSGGRAQDALSIIYGTGSGDPRASVVAALQAAADAGDTKAQEKLIEYKGKLGADGAKVEREASKIKQSLQGQNLQSFSRRMGARFAQADVSSFTQVATNQQHRMLGVKDRQHFNSGLENMFKDTSLVGVERMSSSEILAALSSNDKARSDLTEEERRLVEEYEGASSAGERQSVVGRFEDLVLARGTATGKEVVGSGGSAADAQIDAQQDAVAALAAAMKGQFPNAVQTFAQASKDLQEVARRWPRYYDGVNNDQR